VRTLASHSFLGTFFLFTFIFLLEVFFFLLGYSAGIGDIPLLYKFFSYASGLSDMSFLLLHMSWYGYLRQLWLSYCVHEVITFLFCEHLMRIWGSNFLDDGQTYNIPFVYYSVFA